MTAAADPLDQVTPIVREDLSLDRRHDVGSAEVDFLRPGHGVTSGASSARTSGRLTVPFRHARRISSRPSTSPAAKSTFTYGDVGSKVMPGITSPVFRSTARPATFAAFRTACL